MINKIYKIINNKFPRILKFIISLRYLFLIFTISLAIFLIIPQFFNYEKKEEIIKTYLLDNYDLKVKTLDKIEFTSFPFPYLEIKNLIIDFPLNKSVFRIQKLKIYPQLLSIYDYKNFKVNKIKLEDNDLKIDLNDLKFFKNKFINLKKQISFKNSNLEIFDSDKSFINIKNIDFANYGFNKNKINGEVFNKKFKLVLNDKKRKINFKLIDTGINARLLILDYDQNDYLRGNLRGKILKSNFKLDFFYDLKSIKITNLVFRDKNLSFETNGALMLRPFFKSNFNTEIKDISTNLLTNLNILGILKSKDLIRKINFENNLFFSKKKFTNGLINDLKIKTILEYGRLNILKEILITNTVLMCNNNVNLLDEFPVINFDCKIDSPDLKSFLKKFSINRKLNEQKSSRITVTGYLNILNNKINFNKITSNNDYEATKDDLKFYKEKFEKIIFDEKFINIFDKSKIKNFINEVY